MVLIVLMRLSIRRLLSGLLMCSVGLRPSGLLMLSVLSAACASALAEMLVVKLLPLILIVARYMLPMVTSLLTVICVRLSWFIVIVRWMLLLCCLRVVTALTLAMTLANTCVRVFGGWPKNVGFACLLSREFGGFGLCGRCGIGFGLLSRLPSESSSVVAVVRVGCAGGDEGVYAWTDYSVLVLVVEDVAAVCVSDC